MDIALDATFTAPLLRADTPGGWTVVVRPGSSEVLGTRRAVRVRGEIDGHPSAATMLPVGDGNHLVPLRRTLRVAVGKRAGAMVTVPLAERVA